MTNDAETSVILMQNLTLYHDALLVVRKLNYLIICISETVLSEVAVAKERMYLH